MLYIKLEDAIVENNKKEFLKNNICNLKKYFEKIREEKIENGKVLILPNLEKRIYKKISKYIKVNCITKVCISDNLMKNLEFINFLHEENIEFFDGKWLFKNMNFDIVKYVCDSKKESLNLQEISILSNNIDRVIKKSIFDLALQVRVLNIITQNENKFKKIEKELYEEYGVILNINNNYQKSLNRSDIILNFDFEELNKYNINSKACIINFNKKIELNEKSFSGININFFDLTFPIKYIRDCVYLKDFNSVIFYESLIYKNTSPENIKKELENDKIKINFLIGKNGKIRKNEYLNLSKKIVN